MDGAIILDKPAGITSFVAMRKLRKLLGGVKAGHLGTLDPLGTGVLPVLLGAATRLAQFYLDHEREYVATIRFGWSTSTDDSDGEPLGHPTDAELDEPALESLLDSFRGPIQQVPPDVSAKKVDGVRAYKLARKQKSFELDPVEVEIRELELLEIDGPLAKLRCYCSSGTYIRSLARDLGEAAGCGAHVAGLRRTLVGQFRIDDAYTLEALEDLREQDRIKETLLPAAELLPEIPVHRADLETASRIRHGQDFRVNAFGPCSNARLVKAVGENGQLLCLGKAVSPRLFHPILVFQ